MKKVLLFLSFMLAAMVAFTQNGGQYVENNVVKVELGSKNNTSAFINVINKQPGAADYRVSYGTIDTSVSIPANDTLVFTIPLATAKFKAKAITTVISQPDMGWVELDVQQALPVKFESISVKQTGEDDFVLTFRVTEVSFIDRFEIKLSTDGGKTYNTIAIILPDALNPNITYTAKFHLKNK